MNSNDIQIGNDNSFSTAKASENISGHLHSDLKEGTLQHAGAMFLLFDIVDAHTRNYS